MRPPEFTGGNDKVDLIAEALVAARFNEAAGIHRRKPAILSAIGLADKRLQ